MCRESPTSLLGAARLPSFRDDDLVDEVSVEIDLSQGESPRVDPHVRELIDTGVLLRLSESWCIARLKIRFDDKSIATLERACLSDRCNSENSRSGTHSQDITPR